MRALLAAVLMVTTVAAAETPEPCKPIYEEVEKYVEEHGVTVVRKLTGAGLALAVRVYNNTPPQGNIPWLSAWVAIRSNGYGMLIVGADDLVCDYADMHPRALRDFLTKIDGTGV